MASHQHVPHSLQKIDMPGGASPLFPPHLLQPLSMAQLIFFEPLLWAMYCAPDARDTTENRQEEPCLPGGDLIVGEPGTFSAREENAGR